MSIALLQPCAALVAWTAVLWIWMYATRIPASLRHKPDYSKVKTGAQLREVLPEKVNWISDNYNHLHEQPTVFYAACFILILSGRSTPVDLGLAWAYVLMRVMHSLWQVLHNGVITRFVLFVIASFFMLALTVRVLLAVFT